MSDVIDKLEDVSNARDVVVIETTADQMLRDCFKDLFNAALIAIIKSNPGKKAEDYVEDTMEYFHGMIKDPW